jgi:UPF0042 nucleotide-binding protein
MDLILITGMSGAGKATASNALEEIGYTVVDNLPPTLLPDIVTEFTNAGPSDKLCVVTDARSGKLIRGLDIALTALKETGVSPKLLFIDASNAVLVSRFSETRKRHPFGTELRGVLAGVEFERALVHQARTIADAVIDTSDLKPDQLKQKIIERAAIDPSTATGLAVTLTSFGFKFGLPLDADLVFDVRFLANPHYEDSLRPYDGRNKIIDDFVMKDPATGPYIEKIADLLEFSLPRYVNEGKAYLTVGVGCTGGRHRSIVVVERLSAELQKLGYRVVTNHRDVSK